MFHDKKPYIWGIILGLVVLFAFMTARPVGTATVYERVAGYVIEFFAPEYVYETEHYYGFAPPVADWETTFVIGLLGAGLIARYVLKHRVEKNYVPVMWKERFGTDRTKRYLVSFFAGFLILFGARLANGCTSGNFISGGSQLAMSAYLFGISMFASGIVTALVLYKKRRAA